MPHRVLLHQNQFKLFESYDGAFVRPKGIFFQTERNV